MIWRFGEFILTVSGTLGSHLLRLAVVFRRFAALCLLFPENSFMVMAGLLKFLFGNVVKSRNDVEANGELLMFAKVKGKCLEASCLLFSTVLDWNRITTKIDRSTML